MHRLSVILLAVLLASTGHKCFAQAELRPRLAIDLKGPIGRTHALGFFGSRDRLFAAGEGKVVNIWDLHRDPDGKIIAAIPTEPMRWEFARGALGEINTCVVSEKLGMCLVGGVSANGNHDLVLFSLKNREVARAIPQDPRPNTLGQAKGDLAAHFNRDILQASFSRLGTAFATTSDDGQVWYWTQQNPGPVIKGTEVKSSQSSLELNFMPVAFRDEDSVVFPVLEKDGGYNEFHIEVCDIRSGECARLSSETYPRAVTDIVIASDGNAIYSSDACGTLHIDSNKNRKSTAIHPVPIDSPLVAIRKMALAPNGKMLAVCGDASATSSYLSLYDLPSMEIRDEIRFNGKEPCHAIAFDETGDQLLTHDEDEEALLLWQLTEQNRELKKTPLNSDAPFRITGRGDIILDAAFMTAKSDATVGFEVIVKAKAQGAKIVSLSEGTVGHIKPDAEIDTNQEDRFAHGWKIQSSIVAAGVQNVDVFHADGRRFSTTIIVSNQGDYRGTHCFLANKNGDTFAVAVATGIHDGIFVYGLSQNMPILRYFRDHNGEPISLSLSSDSSYLLSAGRDMTIKVWSLKGLQDPIDPNRESLYGASLELSQNGTALTARNVLPQGILFARNVREGDVISRLQHGAYGIDTHDPREMHNLLRDGLITKGFVIPFHDFILNVARQGQIQPAVAIRPGWEPLMTLLMDKTGEWVLFTPEGYYDASPAEGHTLFGWQFNLGRSVSPRFERASSLQKEFEKPEVIREILKRGSVPEALTALNRQVPPDAQDELRKQILTVPRIRIIEPRRDVAVLPGADIKIVAEVDYSNTKGEPSFRNAATHDGRSLGAGTIVDHDDAGQIVTVEWMAVAAGTTNKFQVGVIEKDQTVVGALQSIREISVAAIEPAPTSGQVFFIGAGAEEYDASIGVDKLRFAIDDVEAVKDLLSKSNLLTRPFAENAIILRNDELTPQRIAKAFSDTLERVKKRCVHDDLIVIFAAGHGELFSGEFCLIPPKAKIDIRNDVSKYRSECISWRLLSQTLDEAPCHVIWLVDVCYSGEAAGEAAKEFNKAGIRESAGFLGARQVLWAANGSQKAIESPFAKFNQNDAGHGYFTLSLLEAISGRAFNDPDWTKKAQLLLANDGVVDMKDIAQYVGERVNQLTDNGQSPVGIPVFVDPTGAAYTPFILLQEKLK